MRYLCNRWSWLTWEDSLSSWRKPWFQIPRYYAFISKLWNVYWSNSKNKIQCGTMKTFPCQFWQYSSNTCNQTLPKYNAFCSCFYDPERGCWSYGLASGPWSGHYSHTNRWEHKTRDDILRVINQCSMHGSPSIERIPRKAACWLNIVGQWMTEFCS